MKALFDLLRNLRTDGNPDRALTVAEMEEILTAIIDALNERQ